MKKVLFVLAMVALFGFATSTVSANITTVDDVKVVLVANDAPEGKETEVKKEEAKSEKKAEAKSEAKSSGCAAKKEGASCGGK